MEEDSRFRRWWTKKRRFLRKEERKVVVNELPTTVIFVCWLAEKGKEKKKIHIQLVR